LIEIKRGVYQHWALYMGKGYVIHVTAAGKAAESVTLVTKRAMVRKQLLKKVTENFDWDINNKYDRYRIPFPMEEIIWRAKPWINKEVPYLLFEENCEHFV
ncbi:HRSL2 protein, partial [Drymodes brunneopygia]|nr:HRSL2 protein [Drymodes brunneopygia]